jgi:hypothetical protein
MPNNVTQGVLFDNCLIIAPDGAHLGRCDKRRIDWYLARDLAELVADNPPTIKLKFEPSGRRGLKDPWTTLCKPNHCVVCGVTEGLNRHHTVPWSFLRHFPESAKKHNSHDVLPTCVKCHTEYEDHSNKKRKHLSEQYGVCLSAVDEDMRDAFYIRGLCRTIITHGEKIPPGRLMILNMLLDDALGHKPTQAEMLELAKKHRRKHTYKPFGQQIIEKIDNFDEFARFWRQHFLDTMKPQHMPDYWRVDRKFDEDYDASV